MPSSGYTAITFTAGEQPTTSKWNLLGSNDASFNTGTGFNDNIILARHMAVGQNLTANVKLDTGDFSAGALGSNQTTSSTTPVDITGASTTYTAPASGGVQLLLFGKVVVLSAAGTQIMFSVNGVDLVNEQSYFDSVGAFVTFPLFGKVNVAAGATVTIKMRIGVGSGSATVSLNSAAITPRIYWIAVSQ